MKMDFVLVADPTAVDFRETSNDSSLVIIIIQSLGVVLIIFFILFYAIKKRIARNTGTKK